MKHGCLKPEGVCCHCSRRIVKRSAAYRGLTHIKADTPAEARRLIAELKALQRNVEHAATVDTGLQDVIDHKTARGKAELRKAERTLATANTVGDRGDKLLGISAND